MSDKTITKRDLVLLISEETGLIQEDVFAVLQKALDHISAALGQGDRIEFRDFGVFEICIRKSRIGRNPHQPTHVVTIPERRVVKFKPGRKMKAEVMKGVPTPPPPTV
jgi:nucleoid DNA-binding protein